MLTGVSQMTAWYNEQERQRKRMKYTPCLNDTGYYSDAPPEYCEVHHIFFGRDRKLSEKYGMKVYLIPHYHKHPPNGVHRNRRNDLELKVYGYNKFNEMYPELEFGKIFKTAWMMDLDEYGLEL